MAACAARERDDEARRFEEALDTAGMGTITGLPRLDSRTSVRSAWAAWATRGSAYALFRRAVDRGNLLAAEGAIRELKVVGLRDALDYVDLLAKRAPARFERAALRWHSRLEAEHPTLTLVDSSVALASLQALVGGDRGNGPRRAQVLREASIGY